MKLSEAINKGRALLWEILPPKKLDKCDKMRNKIEKLYNMGVRFFTFADSPRGIARVAPWAPACMILKQYEDIDVLVHHTRISRNALRHYSDLVAQKLIGINNLLILSGDDPKEGNYPNATKVNDFDIFELIKLASELGIYVGAAVDIVNDSVEKIKKKKENGAKFLVTQAVFDSDFFLKNVERFPDINIVAGIMTFHSRKSYENYMRIPGVHMSEYVRNKLENASDNDIKLISRELVLKVVEDLKNVVKGFYVISLVRDLELAKDILKILKN